ncbi:MAG: HD domain-containing protein [Actinomycetota bacterium]|nr:HD domain-containing protein [Actinomycetota bacterium]
MPANIRLSEVISALSHALDVTGGQPLGHAVRSCAIGMKIGEIVGLGPVERSSLFYALLLKDAGCSSNAAKICALFGADDFSVKRDRNLVNHFNPGESLRYLVRNARPDGSPLARVKQLAAIVRGGAEVAREITELRCERGADIARMIELSEDTARAIRALDEHWDGAGYPDSLAGEDIPLLGRILCLAQTAEVFFAEGGLEAAMEMAGERSGTWFDPELVDALRSTRGDVVFWSSLAGAVPYAVVQAFEPEDRLLEADPDRLDRVAEAFALIIDAKSPYTGRHSDGVARIAVGIGDVMGFGPRELRDLRRAALLHDIGKLGVSNLILDKPGRLDDEEWTQMRRHPALTARILERVSAFRGLADVASAHHERLDGRGYHRGLGAEQLGTAARILAVADVCEALSADRPYRAALARDEMLEIMRRDAGTGLCRECFGALEVSLDIGTATLTPPPSRAASALA